MTIAALIALMFYKAIFSIDGPIVILAPAVLWDLVLFVVMMKRKEAR